MKDIEDLRKSIAAMREKGSIKRLALTISQDKVMVEELLDISFDKQGTLAFRASWMLEHIASCFPDRFRPLVPKFIKGLPSQDNKSCQRHYTKILMCLFNTAPGNPYEDIVTGYKYREDLVDVVFHWYIDSLAPVAVKANCMDVLFYLSGEFDWISEELSMQIESDMRTGSAAIQHRGKKILEKLKRKEGEKIGNPREGL